MDSGRARLILQGIQDRQDASVQPEERSDLVSQGLLNPVDAATRDRWTAAVAGLPSLRDRVREMSRTALATPGPVAPPDLQQMIGSLEELTRQKTNLDAVVWNPPTQEYFLPTLAGRSVLADLTIWQKRLEGRTFPDFLRSMYDYRAGLAQLVGRATAIYGGLLWDEENREDDVAPAELAFTNVDFRFAAMILAKRPINPALLVNSFQTFHHDTNWGSLNKVDRLIGSAILASLPWDFYTVRNAFERIRVELEYHGIVPEDRILASASFADIPQSAWAEVFKRVDDIHRGRPSLNFLLVSALARSPYEPADALARLEEALSGMAARGFKDGIHIEVAACLLAAGPMPREAMVDRFAVAMSHLAGTFDPPYAPAAMIAANPLEPLEAIDVFRDCIGVVTRSSFYELTLEIEEIALILSYGVAPLGLGYLAANLPAGAPVQPVPVAGPPSPVLATSWYIWHGSYVYRPIGWYIATHPVHVHTVAAFG
jgi:hypothetical protein